LASVSKESLDFIVVIRVSKQQMEEQLLKMQQEIRYLRENMQESEAREKKKQ
jgi:septal ring factor EnvC (AmiA/AmiB activator)